MNRISSSTLALTLVVAALGVAGCAKKPIARAPQPTTTAARVGNVRVDERLARACNIQFGTTDRAPKFDYDEATLLPEDRDVLEQVATCVTSGPLRGRHLALVGRADPRGESEYNMVLGDQRADAVQGFLAQLGVGVDTMSKTSRGELDAVGTDDDSWQLDRRVDIELADSKAHASR